MTRTACARRRIIRSGARGCPRATCCWTKFRLILTNGEHHRRGMLGLTHKAILACPSTLRYALRPALRLAQGAPQGSLRAGRLRMDGSMGLSVFVYYFSPRRAKNNTQKMRDTWSA